MTTQEIFAANQVLTVEIAKTLIGKRIAVTNGEYKHNTPDVRICTVLGLETEFEAAASYPCDKYESVQDMWIKENNELAIKSAKRRIGLKYEGQNPHATCDDTTGCLPTGTFFGSDADREIYYVEIDKVKLTRIYHQKEGGRVCDFLTNLTLEEVIEQNDFLKDADRKILNTKIEYHYLNDNPKCRETFKNGILTPEYLDKKPNAYTEERAWNEMYQKHTGNPLPKGGVLR